MERYELVEGSSSKFWEVEHSGTDVTVRFGRIGTNGQTKTKTFADATAARKEWEKLVKEKTGKGYALVSNAGTLPAAKPAASPQTKAQPGPPLPAPAASKKEIPSQPPAAPIAGELVWPTGGFQWKDEWREELPVVRGIRLPAPEPANWACTSYIPRLAADPHGYQVRNLDALKQALGANWVYWGTNSPDHITPEALKQRDHGFWLELMAQCHCGSSWGVRHLAWAVSACIELHGVPFALEVAMKLWEAMVGSNSQSLDLLQPLRDEIARADETAYQRAYEAADELRRQSPDALLVCAHLFPHLGDWAEEALTVQSGDPHQLLKSCTLSASSFASYLRKHHFWIHNWVPALLLQIHLHGEAAFEALELALAKSLENKDSTQKALELVLRMRIPGLIRLLVARMENKEVRAGLDKIAEEYPAATLSCAIRRTLETRERALEGWSVRLALRHPVELDAALAPLQDAERTRFQAVLSALQCEEAPADRLPEALRAPVWLRKTRHQDVPTLNAVALPLAERLEWSEQELAEARQYQVPHHRRNMPDGETFPQYLGIKAAGIQRLLQGEPLQPDDVSTPQYSSATPDLVLASPKSAQLLLWNSYPPTDWSLWGNFELPVRALLAQHGTQALPGLLRWAQVNPDKALPLAKGVDSPLLVGPMLRAFRNLKKSRDTAEKWIRAHPRTVLTEALPQAFKEGSSSSRDDARHAIRWLTENGFEPLVLEVAQSYGAEMTRAVEALQALDPLLTLPAKMPRLPTFFVSAAFRRPALVESGSALPLAAVEHIGTMLAISRLDAPYAGLAQVKQACTPDSLAEFAWDLFEAWTAAGSPSKEGWAFAALGLLGDDETARRLAPKIREWPGESAHARAVTGLDLLAAIGSDVALMHLNGIAGKVKFKALQERAKEKIALVAEARGFTPEQLADRLVPDLGLDANGTVELDFGPRKFFVGFDETLKPFVRDSQGARLKDLPKPNKADDAALAEAATERYKQMKKDAKAVASLQLIRLEMGMVARRRWSATDFRLFFLDHPLMRHLAARLVWGVYQDGQLAHNFRVAEDWTLADANDQHYEVAADATVGISHVLEMSKESLTAFGQLFADYEIQQPFRQLDRETYSLTDEEKQKSTLTRFAGKVVATGSVMGLTNRGWERGEAQDAGWVGWFSKGVGDGLQADVQLDPGTVVGDMSYEPKQKMPELILRREGTYDSNGHVPFGQLDPILASEVLRDLDLLAPVAQ